MTLKKLQPIVPSLKPPIEWDFRSDIQIEFRCCQARYVGQNDQHVIGCFKKHQKWNAQVSNHFAGYNVVLDKLKLLLQPRKVYHISKLISPYTYTLGI